VCLGDGTISVSVQPGFNYFLIQNRVTRARKNSVDLFREMVGSTLRALAVEPGDRSIRLTLDGGRSVVCKLYNTAASNILMVDSTGMILEAFKRDRALAHTNFRQEPRPAYRTRPEEMNTLVEAMLQRRDQTVRTALKHEAGALSTLYAREVLFRSGVAEDVHVGDLGEAGSSRIRAALEEVFAEARHPQPTVYLRTGGEMLLSVFPLRHTEGLEAKEFPSLNDAVKYCMTAGYREKSFEEEKGLLLETLREDRVRVERALAAASERDPTAPERHERMGKLLLGQLAGLRKGMAEITLEDTFGESGMVRIPLERALTPVQNAERYFEKAKAARAALEQSARRQHQLASRARLLADAEAELARCGTERELKECRARLGRVPKAERLIRDEHLPPFRIFTVAGGMEVWVGKNNQNNDLLTLKFAGKNDLWFHVRGASGSHTVLRVPGGSQSVPREAIQGAAGIAAYYSKMRKAGTVPVVYCERKYVRKPKGAAPGAVVLEREKVIFVRPKLP
jgi:predicted ribosome quality control (RQC) complex YloA/Tae2 family protein